MSAASLISDAVERRDPDDDDLYPLAPLPAHERVWRHPSEVGAAGWAHTEPPLALGRGLAVAVSMIGGLLTITVLWAVMSTNAGTGSAVTVASPGERSGLLNWVLPQPGAARPAQTSPSAAVRSTAPATLPAHVVAVSVGRAGTLALTTAAAVEGRSEVDVNRPDGSSVVAHVLFADLGGVAVLRLESPSLSTGLDLGSRPAPGDTVRIGDSAETTVEQQLPTTFRISSPCPSRGAPVIDLDGRLVGLCEAADSYEVGDIQFVRALQNTLAELAP